MESRTESMRFLCCKCFRYLYIWVAFIKDMIQNKLHWLRQKNLYVCVSVWEFFSVSKSIQTFTTFLTQNHSEEKLKSKIVLAWYLYNHPTMFTNIYLLICTRFNEYLLNADIQKSDNIHKQNQSVLTETFWSNKSR